MRVLGRQGIVVALGGRGITDKKSMCVNSSDWLSLRPTSRLLPVAVRMYGARFGRSDRIGQSYHRPVPSGFVWVIVGSALCFVVFSGCFFVENCMIDCAGGGTGCRVALTSSSSVVSCLRVI